MTENRCIVGEGATVRLLGEGPYGFGYASVVDRDERGGIGQRSNPCEVGTRVFLRTVDLGAMAGYTALRTKGAADRRAVAATIDATKS